MKRIPTSLLLPAVALFAGLLSSCRHKDLYMDDAMSSRLQVVFDWRNAPDANPQSMAMYLYEFDGNNPMRFIFSGRDGGEIKAPFGTRHALCLNADNTDWLRMRKVENVETMELLTLDADALPAQRLRSESIPRAEGTEDERMAQTPGMLWGSRLNNIEIAPHEGTQTITMYPQEQICYYTVDILDVDNLDGVSSSSIDATLSGMAEGCALGQQTATDTPVTMSFTLSSSGSDSLHGEFLTFGECPHTSAKHYLTVYMVLKDGSGWYHSYDVTDQVTNAPDPRHVHIVVRGLPLPEPPDSGAGGTSLIPTVNDWQPVYIDLQM